jgi:acetyl esterase/lipase
MDTGSYKQFAEGYFLTAKSMAWFWDAYVPDLERRSEPFASPLRATDDQLDGIPPAFVIVDEADVLRDEGEAYAAYLRAAGVPVTTVRYDGITHDFMMLNPLSGTHATRAAVAQANRRPAQGAPQRVGARPHRAAPSLPPRRRGAVTADPAPLQRPTHQSPHPRSLANHRHRLARGGRTGARVR